MAMALSIMNRYNDVTLEIVTASKKPGVKAPAVLVDDVVLAEDEGKNNGVAEMEEVVEELLKRGAARYPEE